MKFIIPAIILFFIFLSAQEPSRFNNNDLGHPVGWIFGAVLVFFAIKEHIDSEKRRNEEEGND